MSERYASRIIPALTGRSDVSSVRWPLLAISGLVAKRMVARTTASDGESLKSHRNRAAFRPPSRRGIHEQTTISGWAAVAVILRLFVCQ
jgi:hypothetical protein